MSGKEGSKMETKTEAVVKKTEILDLNPRLTMMKLKHKNGAKLVRSISTILSPWILHFDVGGCNGCPIEILAALTPRYDLERFGALNKGNPKVADILLVTGTVTAKCKEVLINLYSQMPEPKVVMAIGSCCCEKGVFDKCYNVRGPIYKIIPVDVYVPGCAPRPGTIIEGVKKALALWVKKMQAEA